MYGIEMSKYVIYLDILFFLMNAWFWCSKIKQGNNKYYFANCFVKLEAS